MDFRKILLLSALLLIVADSVSACVWSPAVGAVTFTRAKYRGACIDYTWSHTQTANDFNNYVIHATGDVTISDFNAGGNTFTICTVEPGDTVTFYVRAYDGNAEGHFCSYDYNVTVETATLPDTAKFLVYTIMVVIAGIIAAVVFIIVVLWMMKKMGMRLPGFKK